MMLHWHFKVKPHEPSGNEKPLLATDVKFVLIYPFTLQHASEDHHHCNGMTHKHGRDMFTVSITKNLFETVLQLT